MGRRAEAQRAEDKQTQDTPTSNAVWDPSDLLMEGKRLLLGRLPQALQERPAPGADGSCLSFLN